MNNIHLDHVLSQYIERYDELNDLNGNDEGYKWRAAACFKKHWDVNADDFPTMFKNAFRETENLIDNSTVQPVGGILMLLNHPVEVEFVRKCFKDLFSEDNGDIDKRQERVNAFMEKINSRIEIYVKGSWKYPQQRNNVIYYLNLWSPEQNYIFKATEAVEWANCVEFSDDFGSGTTFSLRKYYKMCDELLVALRQNKIIMNLYNERLKTVNGFYDDGHILVYDIIYCAKAYNLYKNIPTLQKLSTKQRLKIAETAEKRELLLERISEISSILKSLNLRLSLPRLIGENVTHRKWGKGKIITCETNIVEVSFEDGVKKLEYPNRINTFLILENNNYSNIFAEYNHNLEVKKKLENELKLAQRDLEALN